MKITIRSLYATLILAVGATSLMAQDKPAEKPAPKSEFKVIEDGDEADPVAAWKKYSARKLEIFNSLQQLKKDFSKAEGREAQAKVRDQFVDLLREFDVDVEPKLIKFAPAVFQAQPDNAEAGEFVMQTAFNDNNFEKSGEIAAKLIAANYKSKAVLQTAGVSQFALHNFEAAAAVLNDAQKNNKLDPRFIPFVDAATKYVDLWKAEQEIRDKEAKLEGDLALPRVAFETSKGKIVIELFEDHAPNTVANFVSLVAGKKYDGIKFHRVINGFMAQGGDPNTLNTNPLDDGQGGPGYSIKCECHDPKFKPRMHFRGSLSMAHAGKDSGGSQFFITHLPTEWLNSRSEPEPGGHTVFGRVVEGLDIAMSLRKDDKIETATVLRKRPHDYQPAVTPDPDAKKPEAPQSEKVIDEKKSEQ